MNDLSVKEAMEILHVSEDRIRRLIKRGDLPNTYLQDRKRWIPQREIDAYLQRQQQAPAPEAMLGSEPDLPPLHPEAEASLDEYVPEKPQPAPMPLAPAPKQTPVIEAAGAEEPVRPAHPSAWRESRPADESRTMIPIIAQPIDELEPSPVPPAETPSAPPTKQTPAPYQPGTIQPSTVHEQSFKWILVQTGIISTNWLEKLFRQIRTALERYKAKTFPDVPESENKEQASRPRL
jgi:excisionase family DNA binding protein